MTIVMTFTAKVADPNTNTRSSENITNTGAATWTDPVLGAQTRTSAATAVSVVEPLISQTKTDDTAGLRVVPDQIVTYTLKTTNSNAARVSIAHDTTVVDHVPSGLTPIGAAPTRSAPRAHTAAYGCQTPASRRSPPRSGRGPRSRSAAERTGGSR